MEPEQLGQTLPADTGVQLHPGPTDQQHLHQALWQLPWTGTALYPVHSTVNRTPSPGTKHSVQPAV